MLIFVVELFPDDAQISECSTDDDRAWGRWQKVTRFRNVSQGTSSQKNNIDHGGRSKCAWLAGSQREC